MALFAWLRVSLAIWEQHSASVGPVAPTDDPVGDRAGSAEQRMDEAVFGAEPRHAVHETPAICR